MTEFPSPPETLIQPDEYAWGDATASRDERMARHVTNRLAERFGQARELHYVARDPEAVQHLEQWYLKRLGNGWEPLDLAGTFGPGEAGFGFARGDQALVAAWLQPQADGRVPVTFFRYGP